MKKIVIAILVLLTICVILIFWAPNLYSRIRIYIEIKRNFSKSRTPWAYVVPVNRSLTSSVDSSGTYHVYIYDGVEFKSPWGALIKDIDLESSKIFIFEKRKSIQIFNIDNNQFKIIESLIEKNSTDTQFYGEVFGNENIDSEYAIHNLSLATSPSQVKLLMPFNELGQKSVMLIVKAAIFVNSNKIFRFRNNNVRGFQFGEPDNYKDIPVHIFDKNDRLYRIIFSSVNQDEIDYILSSIKFMN